MSSSAETNEGDARDPFQLDRVCVQRLHELDPQGKHGVVARVLTAYEASLGRLCQLLEAQLQADAIDWSAVLFAAHTLKSSSASVGALSLASACSVLESRIREQPKFVQKTEIENLLYFSKAALVAVRAILPS